MRRIWLILPMLLLSQSLWANTLRFAVLGDAGYWNENAATVRASIERSGIRDLIMPGDNLYEGAGSYLEQWKERWGNFQFPIVAIGNHTVGYAEEVKFFQIPGEYYTKVYGTAAKFIVLNSDNEKTTDQQLAFLDAELQKEPTTLFTFLVFHHPPYSISTRHNWTEKPTFLGKMREYLKVNGDKITSLIVGHDHLAAFYTLDALPMIVSGAAFETFPMTKDSYRSSNGTNVNIEWAYSDMVPTWAKMEIDDVAKKAKVSFIRGSDDKVLHSIFFAGLPLKNREIKPVWPAVIPKLPGTR